MLWRAVLRNCSISWVLSVIFLVVKQEGLPGPTGYASSCWRFEIPMI